MVVPRPLKPEEVGSIPASFTMKISRFFTGSVDICQYCLNRSKENKTTHFYLMKDYVIKKAGYEDQKIWILMERCVDCFKQFENHTSHKNVIKLTKEKYLQYLVMI